MDWKKVGGWIKDNAGTGAALVGSLLSGNVPGAVGAGVALVTAATGEADPEKVLAALQTNPETLVKLKDLAYQNEASIRQHIQAIAEIEAKDAQAEHEQTQLTIRAGDAAEDPWVRRTRPLQSWASLVIAAFYLGWREYKLVDPSSEILILQIGRAHV